MCFKQKILFLLRYSRGFRFALVIISALCNTAITSEPAPVVINEKFESLYLGNYIEYYVDITNSLKIQDVEKIKNEEWQKPYEGRLAFGQTPDTYWFRFKVEKIKQKPKKIMLTVEYASIDYITLYKKLKNNQYEVIKRGDMSVYDIEKGGSSFHHVFELIKNDTYDKLIYLRISSQSSSIMAPVKIWTQEKLAKYDNLLRRSFSMYYGLIIGIIIYNLFLFFSIRDKGYLFYFLYHVVLMFHVMNLTGDIHELKFLSGYFRIYGVNMVMEFHVFFLVFVINILNLRKNLPKAFYFYISIILGHILLVPFLLISKQYILVKIINNLIFVAHFSTLIVSIVLVFKKNRSAYYILPAMICINSGIITRILAVNGLVSINIYTLYGYVVGISVEGILLSLALADRYNTLKKEKEIAQAQSIKNLKRSDEIKNRFLANTSHELRTPLHGIIGLVDSLIEKKSDPEELETLALVSGSARRLNSLVNDILDYAGIAKNEITLEKKSFYPDSAIKEAVMLGQALIRRTSKNKDMKIVINSGIMRPVWGDEKRLLQVLTNLIGNAIKYSNARTITVGSSIGDRYAQFMVQDDGDGIAPDRLSRIFEPFQTESLNKTDGVGLGLSIAKEIIDAHGGKIFVTSETSSESEYIKGTVFTFTLPLALTTFYENNSDDNENVPKKEFGRIIPYFTAVKDARYTLLLVDDELLNLQVYQHHLSNSDFNLLTAQSALEAEAIIEKNRKDKNNDLRIDLMLLDIMMPDISGIELMERLRKKYDLNELPIILVSALDQTSNLADGLNAGANDYIVKPYRPEGLRHRIKKILERAKEARRAQEQRAESILQLKKQKEEIFADMHDHLGSQLTDMKIIYENLLSKKAIDPAFALELKDSIDRSLQTLRSRISNIEDIASLSEDFLGSLQTIFLRRYMNSQRKLVFEYDEVLNREIMNNPDSRIRETVYTVTKEMVTNDLKYGAGQATWKFVRNNDNFEVILVTETMFKIAQHGTGNGTFNIQRRVEEVGGKIKVSIEEKIFKMIVMVPVV